MLPFADLDLDDEEVKVLSEVLDAICGKRKFQYHGEPTPLDRLRSLAG